MPGPLLVCDLPLLMYRSFFALPKSIKGADGQPVNALLGTANAVLAEIESHRPRAVVLCDGAEGAAYRIEAFPGYHADREPMPEALAHQFALGPGLWDGLGWLTLDAGDLEADDLLATLARREAVDGGRALILTGDRDLLQCASDAVAVLLTKPGAKGAVPHGPNEVEALLGVEPERVPDLIALRGDPSDGIPGAPGIGAKTAADLLARHGDLEAVLAAADGERQRVAASLVENADLLRTFKDVATVRDLEAPPVPDRETDRAAGAAAAANLGMKRLAERLTADDRPTG
ncbi:MAG: 5'-3' exonuclease H3TH domain-containing protein [Actinomycetes bacterium]